MLHAFAARFDMTGNLEKLFGFLGQLLAKFFAKYEQ